MIDHSPAPRHRRRIIKKYASSRAAEIQSIADVGCGNGALLHELSSLIPTAKQLTGFDVSPAVISENKARFQRRGLNWLELNLEDHAFDEKYDLVVCSEVLEHLSDWQTAFGRLLAGTGKYLVISVPSGRVFPIDMLVGHYRHFTRKMVEDYLDSCNNLEYRIEFWGFPFHMLYKRLINIRARALYRDFAQEKYGWLEKLLSAIIDALFFLNIRTHWQTNQMFVFIKKLEQDMQTLQAAQA